MQTKRVQSASVLVQVNRLIRKLAYCHLDFPFHTLSIISFFRFRTTQNKSKKETKLEFFGFEENEAQDADGDATASGSTSYKIKYFGFDDLSESDSEDEDDSADKERKKNKKAVMEALATSVGSPQINDSQDSQQSQSSLNAGTRNHTSSLLHGFIISLELDGKYKL